MRQWRLIYDNPAIGAVNMAIDEAILTSVSQGNAPSTLRLYTWEPFCLSLGYGQRSRDADEERIATQGWHIVRRPTGGRAILHGDELTYSLALPINHPLAQGDVITSYKHISEALLCALDLLNIASQSQKQPGKQRDVSPVCFEIPSHYEITAGGRKLIGSAQLRRSSGILQHGSLPLYGDISRICDALAYENDDLRDATKIQVRDRAITLSDVAGQQIDIDTVAEAFVAGFQQTFDLEFILDSLSDAEIAHAETLFDEKYSQPDWTHKRQ